MGRFRPVNDDVTGVPKVIEEPPGPGHNGGPPLDPFPEVPFEEPIKAVRNAFLRRAAAWLAEAAADTVEAPEVAAFLGLLAATAWLASHISGIKSYSDPPQDLSTLQDAVDRPTPGTEVHHIVETQYGSERPDANSEVFKDGRLENRENKVRIPYWKHREIGEWYSTPNREYGGKRPESICEVKAGSSSTVLDSRSCEILEY